jgi:hypothetical protein
MELQIIRAQEFIRLGAHGRLDMKISKALLANLAGACRKRGINQALLDLRALQPKPKPIFTPDDLVKLVKTFREIGFTHAQRLAVLYDSDLHNRARLFAFIARLRGWHVQAFGEFEPAIHWLSSGEEPKVENELPASAKKIPLPSSGFVPAAKTIPVLRARR